MARFILGGDIYIHQSRMNFKPGFNGKEFYWHSDFETWHVEDGMPRMRALSCSILLTDNDINNGPLMLVPGSHRHYITCVGETPENHYQHSLRKQEYGVPDHNSLSELVSRYGIDTATGPAGSVVFFDCNTMHGSNSNITPAPRSNLFFVYNQVGNSLQDPYCHQAPRPGFIADRGPVAPLAIAPSGISEPLPSIHIPAPDHPAAPDSQGHDPHNNYAYSRENRRYLHEPLRGSHGKYSARRSRRQ
ncbi:phytanoyl-CoA dioxygenase family protein [Marinobacterium aestuariivivens]|uniref:Phytanoyl-CoA dioxygenase family protein n=1 Tax=Marinobacterium aestuariivivens TaxID=1698799 RepID=A0ABW1ZYU4_9GAMM